MWIETGAETMTATTTPKFIRQQWRMWIETVNKCLHIAGQPEFIRQQWRMWIETVCHARGTHHPAKFIRQQWRMWIETCSRMPVRSEMWNSFASNGECGLKPPQIIDWLRYYEIHSPAMANVD